AVFRRRRQELVERQAPLGNRQRRRRTQRGQRPEPGDDRLVLTIEANLTWADPAVDTFLAVRVGKRAGQLDGQIDRVGDRHPTRGQPLVERVVADRRRDDEVRQLVRLRKQQGEDVAVRQPRGTADVLVVAGRVLRERRVEHLDDHRLVEQLVARPEAARELAFTDRFLDVVDRREIELRNAFEAGDGVRDGLRVWRLRGQLVANLQADGDHRFFLLLRRQQRERLVRRTRPLKLLEVGARVVGGSHRPEDQAQAVADVAGEQVAQLHLLDERRDHEVLAHQDERGRRQLELLENRLLPLVAGLDRRVGEDRHRL